MKRIIVVFITLLILASACAPKEEVTESPIKEETEPADDSKLDMVIEKVEDLVKKVTESTSEPAEEVEAPAPRRIPESNPIVREDTLPLPLVRLEMNNDPTLADPLVVERRGAIRSDLGQGKIKEAWKFDGRDDYVITSIDNLRALESFTIVVWVKPGDFKKRSHLYWQGFEDLETRGEFAGNGWGPEQELHLSTGDELGRGLYEKEKITFYFGDKEKSMKVSAPMSNLDWQQVVIVVENKAEGATAEMYLDAQFIGKSSVNAMIARDTWGRLFFGKAAKDGPQGDSDRDFAGLLDEFAIYDETLTADEVAKLCRRQNDGKICNGLD